MNAPSFPNVLIVGMHFRPNGKAIVGSLIPPYTLDLEREPENAYDGFAIKALHNGEHIGYIERKQAMFIAPWMDQGQRYTCHVEELQLIKNNLHPVASLVPDE